MQGFHLYQAGDGVELRPRYGLARLRFEPATLSLGTFPASASERCFGCLALVGARQRSWELHYFLHYLAAP